MTFIGANAAGLKNKSDSFLRLISNFKPGAVFVQETKVRRKMQFKVKNYECFELVRTDSNGGGLLTAVHESFDPVEIPTESDQEILVVESLINGNRVRLINGYGPQEYVSENVRQQFFTQLDLEIKKAKLAGALIIIEMDSNAKLGSKFIPSDPKVQTENGVLLGKVITENNLVVVNGQPLCKGSITRYRKTIKGEEQSILDHFVVCDEMFKAVTNMLVDEAGMYSLTKYTSLKGSKVTAKESDHRTILLDVDWKWKMSKPETQKRLEIYNFNDPESFDNFVRVTSDNLHLRNCFEDDNEDVEVASKRWLKILNDIIKTTFSKIRIKKNCMKPDLEQLFKRKEELKSKLAMGNLNESDILKKELADVEQNIGDMCAERNRVTVEEYLAPYNDADDGLLPIHTWALKKKLAPKNTVEPPTAKIDAHGSLITDKVMLENLYLETYVSRLKPNSVTPDFEELMTLKSTLFEMNYQLAQCHTTEDWTLKDLEQALRSLKNNKARDIHGHTYELFKFCGKDLKESLLKLFNMIKRSQKYPSILSFSSITSIWKRKGSQRDLENDRGIFNVTKIRSILDRMIYNDIYSDIDESMSCSNIGARKNRNIRDHLFVINGIFNEAANSSVRKPLDIQIYDVKKCFDKLEFHNTANDLFRAGIQNDKFVLVSNSNKVCNVSVKLPWGKLSKGLIFNDIEMQGTVLAPLKCSLSIDRIGKEALETKHTNLFKYRDCVTIPPLGMVDDILAVSECSIKSVMINGFIDSKIKCLQLELGELKCAQMHVGAKSDNCHELRVNNLTMKRSTKETYLGEILSSDGKINDNITGRHNKGIGAANTIISLLKEVYFGKYYFEMAFLFRNSMLINSMLCSIEALYGLKDTHIEKLESVDRYFLRKLLNASSKTAVEALYLETGVMPLRFTIISRRLMFYWTLLSKSENELVRKVYDAQKLAPLKNDWVLQIKDDLESCNINLTEAEISKMKRNKFKCIVKEKVREQARNFLVKLKSTHSKSKSLNENFKLQPYLKTDKMSQEEKKLLFKFRTNTYDCKVNFRWNFSDTKCLVCTQEDTQEHLINCPMFDNLNLESFRYENIFGKLEEQIKLIKVLNLIDQKRSELSKSSLTGGQAQPLDASCTTTNCI